MTEQEIIDIVTHYKNGGEVEFKHKFASNEWLSKGEYEWNFKDCDYRKKPEKKIVPWTAETIPFPLAVKVKGSNNGFRSLVSAGSNDLMLLYFYGGDSVVDCVGYEELLKDYETRDGQPCGEVVEG